MGKRIRFVAACALTSGALSGGVLIGITSAGAQVEPIRVDLPGDRVAFLDFDGDGQIDMGDRVTGRSRVVDPATGESVGRAFTDCVAMTRIVVEQQKGTWVCTHVLVLGDGHIILQGEDPAGVGPNVLAVTGGTALFRNARGQADQLDASDPDRTEITIHLEP
jgi:hypothetical protein